MIDEGGAICAPPSLPLRGDPSYMPGREVGVVGGIGAVRVGDPLPPLADAVVRRRRDISALGMRSWPLGTRMTV